MAKRHNDALAINIGACNPSGIALSIVDACREIRAEPDHQGTEQITSDPAVRLMVLQLAHICGVPDMGSDDYNKAKAACESLGDAGYIKCQHGTPLNESCGPCNRQRGEHTESYRETFWTPYDQYRDRIGQHFVVLRKITADNATDAEREEYDDEVLPMYRIHFEDGFVTSAWPDEVVMPSAAEVVDINNLIEFANTKPAWEDYNFYNTAGECPFSQYMQHKRLQHVPGSMDEPTRAIWESMHDSFADVADETPRTWGYFAARLSKHRDTIAS